MNRRRFLASAAAFAVSPALFAADKKRITPADAFDPVIHKFMRERGVPGGALAVVKDRRLVHARGYGLADCDQQLPPAPDSLFRIASITKPLTAVALLHLVQRKKFDLDDRVFSLLKLGDQLPKNSSLDERWKKITLRHLLHHTGGWDRDKSGDPMFKPGSIARALDEPAPARPWTIIRHMLGKPLDFGPGSRYAYSNFGYCLLGRVIEKITGQPCEDFVRNEILAPIGITRMRLGATLEAARADGEVRYYTARSTTTRSVFGEGKEQVPWPYGGFHLEAMDAHGGWIASAVDLVRFSAALDEAAPRPLLRADTLRVMRAPPAPPVSRDDRGRLADHWYGCGWLVRPVKKDRFNLWHAGSLPGTFTFLASLAGGVTYAALFNQRSEDSKNGDDALDPGPRPRRRRSDRLARGRFVRQVRLSRPPLELPL